MLNFEYSNYLVVLLPITFHPLPTNFYSKLKTQNSLLFWITKFHKGYKLCLGYESWFELRITSYGSRFSVLGFRLSVLDSRVTLHELRVTNYELRLTSYDSRFTVSESRVTLLASLRSAPPRVASRKRIKKRSTKLLSYD